MTAEFRNLEHGNFDVETGVGLQEHPEKNQGMVWLTPDELAKGFENYNRGLAEDLEIRRKIDLTGAQRELDDHLWRIGEITGDSLLPNHMRNVGGYAGALVREFGGRFNSPYHQLVARFSGGLHDAGKGEIDIITLHRSLGHEGWGHWDENRDRPEMESHTWKGKALLETSKSLPQETAWVAGCHHCHECFHRPYGLTFDEIDQHFGADSEQAEWLKLLVKFVIISDVYSAATERADDFQYPNGMTRMDYIKDRINREFPDQAEDIFGVLQAEQFGHHMRRSKVGEFALQAA
jgi:hypothetical protein